MLWDRDEEGSVEEIELGGPKAGEVLVTLDGSGLCHSDEHVLTGDLPWPLPMIGGHEGAGVVQEAGPGVTDVAPDDQVILSFLPVCGRCRPCAQGMSNLCEFGLRTGRLVVLDNAAHLPDAERPDAVDNFLVEHLARCRLAAPATADAP